jgi:hypothetical protein
LQLWSGGPALEQPLETSRQSLSHHHRPQCALQRRFSPAKVCNLRRTHHLAQLFCFERREQANGMTLSGQPA